MKYYTSLSSDEVCVIQFSLPIKLPKAIKLQKSFFLVLNFECLSQWSVGYRVLESVTSSIVIERLSFSRCCSPHSRRNQRWGRKACSHYISSKYASNSLTSSQLGLLTKISRASEQRVGKWPSHMGFREALTQTTASSSWKVLPSLYEGCCPATLYKKSHLRWRPIPLPLQDHRLVITFKIWIGSLSFFSSFSFDC